MGNLLIRCKAILTMDGPDQIIPEGEIAIKDNLIYHVGPRGTTPRDFLADTIYEYPHQVAMPGLINCHTHAAMTLFRGYADDMPLMQWLQEKIWPLEEHLTPDDIYQATLLACVEMIMGGTTTFADMYFAMDQVARAVELTGMRALLSRGMVGAGPNAQLAMDESEAFIRKWHGGAHGRITAWFGPHAPYTCPPEYLKEVLAKARELNVGIHIHLAETNDELQQVQQKYGQTPVALMDEIGLFTVPVLAAHCVHLTTEEIAMLSRPNVGVSHNPQSNMKLASGTAPIPALLAAGATVGLGTDGASSNNNLDLWEEIRTATLLHKLTTGDATALPAYQALSMATVHGAKALGLESQIGRLKPGFKADLIMIDMQKPHLTPLFDYYAHLAYAASAADVCTVIIDGKTVMRRRCFLGLDEEVLMDNIQRVAQDLVRRSQQQ